MKTNFQFGISQINKPTPLWAKYTFRIVFLLLSVAIFMVSDYPGMNEGVKLLLLKWFSGINMLVWGLSKMVGVEENGNADDATGYNNNR
ncbi:MAG: hypothetical protein ACK4EY_07080 [Flavipsychrobacter sp.]|jgi:hypothetical protein|nr:hypothetical protein [Chitinophagales bacterium]